MPVGEPPFFFGGPDTLAEKRMPDRCELDRAAPDHPVCITGVFGNWGRPPGYTALNTLALRLNGIGRESKPSCSGVTIERDASGEPTGVIIERNNRPTVEFDLLPAVPKFDAAARLQAIRTSMRLYNGVGTTSVYEGHGSAPETIACYRQLAEERRAQRAHSADRQPDMGRRARSRARHARLAGVRQGTRIRQRVAADLRRLHRLRGRSRGGADGEEIAS